MKISLINTGQYQSITGFAYPPNTFQPLGLGYLAAVLLQMGHQVKILDILAEGFEHEEIKRGFKYIGLPLVEVKRLLKEFSPDMVGISMPFTIQSRAGHEIAQLVKTINNIITVVVGGSYPTTYPELVLKDRNIDFLIMGEGEEVFKKLIENLGNKKYYQKIFGLAYRDKGLAVINKRQLPLVNLDKYRVAWELLPMEKYFLAANQVKSSRSISTFGKRWATIFTSRGCPFTCTFCVGHEVMGRKWRPRSVENVIAEMEFLIQKYQIEHFDIEDDNFTQDLKRAKEICNEIIKKGWNINWSTPNGIRADTVDEELIRKMKQAGCIRTIVAPESGNQWVVDNLMKKRINLEKVKQVVKWCKKYKIAVDAFFLLGMPGETKKQILETIDFARELRKTGVDECLFGIVVPHRGTDIYKEVIKNNWMKLKYGDKDLVKKLKSEEAFIETPDLSIIEIKQLVKKANRVNPLIPFSRIRLIIRLAIKSPERSFGLFFREMGKRLGFLQGKWG